MRIGLDRFEALARRLDYTTACFYTVVRGKTDPRRPADYKELDPAFEHFGYRRAVEFPGVWPTIQPDGTTAICSNTMVLWVKELAQ
jgi:hypothetical protein